VWLVSATCPGCGADVGAGSRFCADCGAPLGRRCPECGEPADAGKRFCAGCGGTLGGEEGTPAGDPREGEHKPVTVLFCDIVGSTSIAERIGAEAMHALLSRYSDLALEELRYYGGTIDRFMGDGFMALMGVPTAHEDHARRAVLAALALRRRLLRDLTPPGLEPVEVRMGLNSGSVVVGSLGTDPEGDHTAIGDTINVAARLESIAEPGTILISDATARQVLGYVRCEPVGPVVIRGRAEPVVAHRVLGLGRRRSALEGLGSRPMGRFVGRERQLAALQELVAEAASGRGQVVGVVAEPGMGKSRILAELRRSLAGERLTVLEGRCLSYGSGVPYIPLIDIVRANCGITDGDSPAEVGEKTVLGLVELGIDPGARAPLLLRMMGLHDERAADDLTPEAVRQRTFETLLTMCLTGSHRRPLLLVVEDLHWIDRVSEEFLARLVESIQGAPLALVCTYRPGYQAPWMQASYATQLALPRLTLAEGLVVLRAVLGERAADPDVLEEIVAKADGNPFFLEELARALLEDAPGGPEHPVPGTVHDVLLARVDRLAEEPRRVLQTASVLGREFPLRLLEAVWSGPGGLEPHLAELRRLEFIHDRGGEGEAVHVFNHALTQDVAYQSLLSSRKARLHEAAGAAYEALFADRLGEVYDRLAHHYSRTTRADKAVEYLGLLAESAVKGYAHAEAAEALREALRHVDGLPPDLRDRQACELTLRLVYSLYFLGGFDESLDVLRAVEARAARLENADVAGRLHMWLGHTHAHAGDSNGAAASIARAIHESSRSGDVATFGKAHYVLAREAFWLGRFADGAEHGRTAVASLERTDEWWWLGHAHAWVGQNLVNTGDFEEAIASVARTKEIGRLRDDPRLQSYAGWEIAWYEATRGNWERAVAEGTESLAFSPDPLNSAYSMGFLGFSYREKGDHAQAASLLQSSIQLLTEFRYGRLVAWLTGWMSEAQLWSGDLATAAETARRALDLSEQVAYPWAVAVAQRALGRVSLATKDLAAARGRLDEARSAFGRMRCRFDLAVTHMDLAKLQHRLGDSSDAGLELDAARVLLSELEAPIYQARIDELAVELEVGPGSIVHPSAPNRPGAAKTHEASAPGEAAQEST
jgi:class 3 adenylate cyclase/tetratricopeptide (TPR) repeat protein